MLARTGATIAESRLAQLEAALAGSRPPQGAVSWCRGDDTRNGVFSTNLTLIGALAPSYKPQLC